MSGAWLNVIPSPNIGTFLNDDVIRTCIALRLGTKICRPFECACGISVDALGRHGLHCKKNWGKFFRHAELNRIIHQFLASIHISSLLEPTGLFRDDGKKRPDGITYTDWEKGRALVWDATCVDSLAISKMVGRTKQTKTCEIFKDKTKLPSSCFRCRIIRSVVEGSRWFDKQNWIQLDTSHRRTEIETLSDWENFTCDTTRKYYVRHF